MIGPDTKMPAPEPGESLEDYRKRLQDAVAKVFEYVAAHQGVPETEQKLIAALNDFEDKHGRWPGTDEQAAIRDRLGLWPPHDWLWP